ncbi:hypothetical protein NUW58_g583 [Xylaria curta]|uniref:Uncharacterized protein n=1 Tax=Xylaria curta TaxID=42375 RepID=A0ACC1PNT7_9PEZI|nr:hypothetical protein NUW58_g583 [Xylaria curta]
MLATGVDTLAPDPDGSGTEEVKGDVIVGWLDSVIPDPALAGGRDLVPETVSLELLRGKGTLDEILKNAVPEEVAVTLLVVTSEEPSGGWVEVKEYPVLGRLPVPLFVGAVELPRGYGALGDVVSSGAVGRIVLAENPVIVEEGPVPVMLLVSPTPSEVELLKGYGTVCTPVPVTEPPVGPVVGSEEFVMGKGVIWLMTELMALAFVDNVTDNDSEAGIVEELGALNELFVALADITEEFVNGKGRVSVTLKETLVRLMIEPVPPTLGPRPDDVGVLAGPFVGPVTGAEEFVAGNGAVSLTLTEVRLLTDSDNADVVGPRPKDVEELTALNELFVGLMVEFVNGKGAVSAVLEELALFVRTDVGIKLDPVLEVGVPVELDSLFVGLAVRTDVLVNRNEVVWLVLGELKGPVDSDMDGNADDSSEVETAVPLGRLLVGLIVKADESVRGNGVASVALMTFPVVVGIEVEPVNRGTVENSVLGIELVGPVNPEVSVEFERG